MKKKSEEIIFSSSSPSPVKRQDGEGAAKRRRWLPATLGEREIRDEREHLNVMFVIHISWLGFGGLNEVFERGGRR